MKFYLRADFINDSNGVPHDSYWKNIDIQFDDGEIITGEFAMDNRELNPKNSKGQEIVLEEPKTTRKIKLFNFKQVTEILGFAALTELEVYGRYIKTASITFNATVSDLGISQRRKPHRFEKDKQTGRGTRSIALSLQKHLRRVGEIPKTWQDLRYSWQARRQIS